MKVYSWNMLFRNRELDRAFEFVSKTDFDIFCLQEVPEALLTRLKSLPFHLAQAIDADRLFHAPHRAHIITLSRHPIVAERIIHYPSYWSEIPWYGKLTTHILRPIGGSRPENRNALITTIDTPRGKIELYNLHLTLAAPHRRVREFKEVFASHEPGTPVIACGDFNVIESPFMAPLNWLLGGTLSDVWHYARERSAIEIVFRDYGLTNAALGQTTHAFAGSQLDHILVSKHFHVENASVLPDRYGSDHHPLRVDIS